MGLGFLRDVQAQGQEVGMAAEACLDILGLARGGDDRIAGKQGTLCDQAPRPRDAPVMNQVRISTPPFQ
ncbi:hypothetical protein BAY1663_04530 [Pseudomonas sp. BAY1663]|nr:hypothetical protein BAY1663_04530 [Pseudomonas sp. BAY1663]